MALSIGTFAQSRCLEPRTKQEERMAKICAKSAVDRQPHELARLVSYLRKIPAFERTPAWKIDALCRNLGVLFLPRDSDAASLCTDPEFSYFLMSGSLAPIVGEFPSAATLVGGREPGFSGGSMPGPWFVSKTEARKRVLSMDLGHDFDRSIPLQEVRTNVQRKGESRLDHDDGIRFGATCKDVGPESHQGAVDNELGGGGIGAVDDVDVVSRLTEGDDRSSGVDISYSENYHQWYSDGIETMFPVVRETTEGDANPNIPLVPGQALDPYLLPSLLGNDEAEANTWTPAERSKPPDVRQHGTRRTEENGRSLSPRLRWRLQTRRSVCIVGRVSRRVVREVEMEGPRRDSEEKVVLLKKTEVFHEGFSVPGLRRLAARMERREHAAASTVLQKGAVADKIVILASGEAIRLGDRRADTKKNPSSLRIKAGQMFGAEEAVARLPVYTSNLMATSPLVSFSLPTAAFLETIHGTHTAEIRRLAARARITASYDIDLDNDSKDDLLLGVDGRRRFTAAGVDGERSLRTSDEILPVLKPSETIHSPVALEPFPFFSTVASKDYMRITGNRTQSNPEDRINSMAAVYTPWAWRPPAKADTGPDALRPKSAPAAPSTFKQRQRQRQPQSPPRCPNFSSASPFPSAFPGTFAAVPSSSKDDADHNNRRTMRINPDSDSENRANESRKGSPPPTLLIVSSDFRCLGPSRSLFSSTATLTGSDGVILLPSHALFDGGKHNDSRNMIHNDDFSRFGEERHACSKEKPTSPWQTANVENMASSRSGRPRRIDSSVQEIRVVRGRRTKQPTGEENSTNTGDPASPITASKTPPIHLPKGAQRQRRQRQQRATSCAIARCSPHSTQHTNNNNTNDEKREHLLVVKSPKERLIGTGSQTSEPWTDRELVAARRAVRRRPQRSAVCRTFAKREGAAAGMTAAQRAMRGPYVMSRMRNATSRALWRPA